MVCFIAFKIKKPVQDFRHFNFILLILLTGLLQALPLSLNQGSISLNHNTPGRLLFHPSFVLLNSFDVRLFLLGFQFSNKVSQFLESIGQIHVTEAGQVTSHYIVAVFGQPMAKLVQDLILGRLGYQVTSPTLNRTSHFVCTLLTFCPPGPELAEYVMSNLSTGMNPLNFSVET